jgi:hypothetical protein
MKIKYRWPALVLSAIVSIAAGSIFHAQADAPFIDETVQSDSDVDDFGAVAAGRKSDCGKKKEKGLVFTEITVGAPPETIFAAFLCDYRNYHRYKVRMEDGTYSYYYVNRNDSRNACYKDKADEKGCD